MPTVSETLILPGGDPPPAVTAIIQLAGVGGVPLPMGYSTLPDTTTVGTSRAIAVVNDPDADPVTATWSIDLAANATIVPDGTVWRVTLSGQGISRTARYFIVPEGDGPFDLDDLLTEPPGAVAPTELALLRASLGTAAFEDASSFLTEGSAIVALVEGPNVTIDDTDPTQPVVGVDGDSFATADQGATADTAVQPAALAAEAATRAGADTALGGRVTSLETAPPHHATTHGQGGVDELSLAQAQIVGLVASLASKATPTDITTAINNLVGGAPGLLDTLDEIAQALGDDPNFAATITTALAGKQPLDGTLTALAGLNDTSYGRSFIELADQAAGRTLLGLGTAATQPSTAFATAAQGATADTAVQPGALATVATSGAYNDLSGKPTLGTAAATASTAYATAAQGTKADSAAQIAGGLAGTAATPAVRRTLGPLSLTGTTTTGAGTSRLPIMRSMTIVGARAMVGTAPTGASLIVDVNKNGTTIFTTQANRPAIAATTTDSGAGSTPDVTALAVGDYITVDVDQVGSTVAGADLVVVLEVTAT